MTVLLLSGILSLPWSPLASLPPEVDVPLPLPLGFIALPVVGDVPGVAELAAGSPDVAPLPLAPPDWAHEAPEKSPIIATTVGFTTFTTFSVVNLLPSLNRCPRGWFLGDTPRSPDNRIF